MKLKLKHFKLLIRNSTYLTTSKKKLVKFIQSCKCKILKIKTIQTQEWAHIPTLEVPLLVTSLPWMIIKQVD